MQGLVLIFAEARNVFLHRFSSNKSASPWCLASFPRSFRDRRTSDHSPRTLSPLQLSARAGDPQTELRQNPAKLARNVMWRGRTKVTSYVTAAAALAPWPFEKHCPKHARRGTSGPPPDLLPLVRP